MGSLEAKKPAGGNSSKPVGAQEEQVGRVDSRARVGAPGLEPDQLGQILVLPLSSSVTSVFPSVKWAY